MALEIKGLHDFLEFRTEHDDFFVSALQLSLLALEVLLDGIPLNSFLRHHSLFLCHERLSIFDFLLEALNFLVFALDLGQGGLVGLLGNANLLMRLLQLLGEAVILEGKLTNPKFNAFHLIFLD